MSEDDPRDRLQRLRQQVEAHFEAGRESLSRFPSMVTQNFAISHGGTQAFHNRFSSLPPGESQDVAEWHEQQSASVEARLDQCRGGRLEDHYYAWDLFVRRSQYSPLVLDQLSARPRPSDLEADMDPSVFSWMDPFEDLLAASSDLPMMPTRDRYDHRALWAQLSGREPAHLWLGRLRANRLTEVYFPIREADYRSPQTMEEWVQLRKTDRERRAAREKETLHRVQDLAQAFGLGVEQATNPKDSASSRGDRGAGGRQKGPDNELDFFEFIRSTSKEVLPPLTAFLKIFSNGKWVTESSTSTHSVSTGDDVDEESLRTSKSTEEWVKDGYVHTKTEIRKTTHDGREVARETHYSRRPALPEDEAKAETGGDAEARPGRGEAWEESEGGSDAKAWTKKQGGQDEKKNSWLWK